MKEFFNLSFKGLTPSYYYRQLIFGFIIAALFISMAWSHETDTLKLTGSIISFIFLALLYPYSIFVYESIVGFFVGENTFYFEGYLALLFFLIKFIAIIFCYGFSFIIAPIGLIALYFLNKKAQSQQDTYQ